MNPRNLSRSPNFTTTKKEKNNQKEGKITTYSQPYTATYRIALKPKNTLSNFAKKTDFLAHSEMMELSLW